METTKDQNPSPSLNTFSATVITNFGSEILIEDNQQQRQRCMTLKQVPNLVSGDIVTVETDQQSVCRIIAREPRHTVLSRPVRGQDKIIAANIDTAIIVSAPRPTFKSNLVDRYLAAAEIAGLDAVIVLNKCDLLQENNSQQIQDSLAIYEDLGYPVHIVSAKEEQGMDRLANALIGKTSVLIGQSGVGKTSIINHLIPGVSARTSDVSDATNKGRHTTSYSELYHLPLGGQIIDSPGVREFALHAVAASILTKGFREFMPYVEKCQFRDCTHVHEPGCAIQQALQDKKLIRKRWESYCNILNSFAEQDK